MNKFNLESAKFVSIILGICFIFIMVIWHAFDYLPEKDSSNMVANVETVNQNYETNRNKDEKEEVVSEKTEKNRIKNEEETLNKTKKSLDSVVPLETIEEESLMGNKQINNDSLGSDSESSSIDSILKKANDYKKNNQYVASISEYQKALSMTEDKEVKAQCYEEISIIYAKAKRYGSALSAAQKAFNTSPSTTREVLLARLYYKTGDIDKATTRVNNVLNRDF